MNIFQSKIEKQETVVTRLLRKQLINIDDTLKLVKIENEELKELIFKFYFFVFFFLKRTSISQKFYF